MKSSKVKSQSPKSGQLHSNYRYTTMQNAVEPLCLNPLSRVNCILIRQEPIKVVQSNQSLNPPSRVNCILIKQNWRQPVLCKRSQSPKSGQLHSNDWLVNIMKPAAEAVSQSPKSGQLHSNRQPPHGIPGFTRSQSPKSGQLHSNSIRGWNPGGSSISVSIP